MQLFERLEQKGDGMNGGQDSAIRAKYSERKQCDNNGTHLKCSKHGRTS